MSILIGVAVVVVASFVLAYFAARTWHWAYVLVGVGIVIFAAVFYVLSAETLRIHAVLRREYNQVQANLEKMDAQVAALRNGSKDPAVVNQLRAAELKMPEDAVAIDSVADLEHDLRLLTQARGPVWRAVTPAGVDQQTAAVRVTVPEPSPSGLAQDAVLYLFEQGPVAQPDPTRGAQYLGEFRVTEVNGQQATLLPALELNDAQRRRLADSRGPWVLYELMPPDRYDLFADLTEDQLREKLPPESVEEYARHGKSAAEGDDPERVARYDEEGKRLAPDSQSPAARAEFHRRLRDFALELRKLTERRAVLLSERAGLQADIQRFTEANASAQRLTAFRQDEANKLQSDLAGLARDREAIDRLLAQVEQQLATIRAMLEQTLRENSRLVRELAAQQTAAARQIDQAAPAAMAQPAEVGAVN